MSEKESLKIDEQSVYDYLRETLFTARPTRRDVSIISENVQEALNSQPLMDSVNDDDAVKYGIERRKNTILFWFSLLLIFIAQISFELKLFSQTWLGRLFLYAGAVGFFVSLKQSAKKNKKGLSDIKIQKQAFRWQVLIVCVLIVFYGFFLTRNSGFGVMTIVLWLLGIASFIYVFWNIQTENTLEKSGFLSVFKRLKAKYSNYPLEKKRFLLLLVAVFVVIFAFHGLMIKRLPIELVSQQVETYMTVEEIREGARAFMFPRNVVSEPLTYYWMALISVFFGKKLTLGSLYFANLISFGIGLVFLFRLAKLLFGKWVGVLSVLLLGVGYWPVLQNYALLGGSLVFPLISLGLYYLFRALLRFKRNDLLVFGMITGLGLMANKIFLIMPIVGFVSVLIWSLCHRKQQGFWRLLSWFGISILLTLIVCLPFIATLSLRPDLYLDPILSRIGETEVAIVGQPLFVFICNLFDALDIVNIFNRNNWIDGIPGRPALDIFCAVFFVLGLVYLSWQYLNEKKWQNLILLIMLPLFAVPSAMSLAFPLENASLSRAYGMAIPVFMLAGKGLFFFIKKLLLKRKTGRIILISFLLISVLSMNFYYLQKVYVENYRKNAWNVSEMAGVIKKYQAENASMTNAWVVGYPHWVDERAVAITAGLKSDTLLFDREILDDISHINGAKLFVLHIDDITTKNAILEKMPNGVESLIHSQIPGKDFVLIMVP